VSDNLPPLPEPDVTTDCDYLDASGARHSLAFSADLIRSYAAAAVAAERERCAQIALAQTTHRDDPNNEVWQAAYNHVANEIAEAIRKPCT